MLDGASLALAAGEVVALVAPSGAGKSTLLHIAGLLDAPSGGTVRLLGRRRPAGSATARAPGSGATRSASSTSSTTCCRSSRRSRTWRCRSGPPARAPAPAAARARELLAAVGLGHRLDHRPAELSGGEQQRVAFARALANRPRLLLADEPTGNLDPETSGRVFDVLLGLVRDTGLAALIATHNPDLAGRMDRVLRLDGGRVVDHSPSFSGRAPSCT